MTERAPLDLREVERDARASIEMWESSVSSPANLGRLAAQRERLMLVLELRAARAGFTKIAAMPCSLYGKYEDCWGAQEERLCAACEARVIARAGLARVVDTSAPPQGERT